MQISPLSPRLMNGYTRHLSQHLAQSGREGNPIYTPLEDYPTVEEIKKTTIQQSKNPLHITPWIRLWVLHDDDYNVFGHFELRSGHLDSTLHRCTLSLGIDPPYQGKGYASQLMQMGIDWAKDQLELDWIDLRVFSHNEPALKLYKRFQFEEIGRVKDCFRVFGQSITDIHMILNIQ